MGLLNKVSNYFKARQSIPVTAYLGALVVGAIFLFIGIYVSAEVEGSIDTSNFDTDINDSYNNVVTNAFNGFELAGISLIVIAAVGILAHLISAFRGGGM